MTEEQYIKIAGDTEAWFAPVSYIEKLPEEYKKQIAAQYHAVEQGRKPTGVRIPNDILKEAGFAPESEMQKEVEEDVGDSDIPSEDPAPARNRIPTRQPRVHSGGSQAPPRPVERSQDICSTCPFKELAMKVIAKNMALE